MVIFGIPSPGILSSIPNRASILFKDPESRTLNEGDLGSRKPSGNPLFGNVEFVPGARILLAESWE